MIQHHAVVDQIHPVVKLHFVLLAINWQAQGVLPAKGIATRAAIGHADHIVGASAIATIAQVLQSPDAALSLAVAVHELFVEHPIVAIPAAVHCHHEAAFDQTIAVAEHAVRLDLAVEIFAQIEHRLFGRIVGDLRRRAACQCQQRSGGSAKQQLATGGNGIHGEETSFASVER